MNNNNHEEITRSIVSKVLKIKGESIGLADDLVQKFNMDSMQRVEIVIELETRLDIEIPDDDAINLRSLQKILDYLNQAAHRT